MILFSFKVRWFTRAVSRFSYVQTQAEIYEHFPCRKDSWCWIAKSKALSLFQHSLGSCLNLPSSAPEGVLSCPRYVFSWKCVSGSASLLPRLFYFGSQCHVIPLASESPAEGMATACWEQCKSEKKLLVFAVSVPHTQFLTLLLPWTFAGHAQLYLWKCLETGSFGLNLISTL